MNLQDQPEPDANLKAVNNEMPDNKIGIPEEDVNNGHNSRETSDQPEGADSFSFINNIFSNLFKKHNNSPEVKEESPALIENPSPHIETEGQESLVEKRLGNLYDEEEGPKKVIPQLSDELPDVNIQNNLILAGLSTEIIAGQPPQPGPPVIAEKPFLSIEDDLQTEKSFAPFLPQDFDEIKEIEETSTGEEEVISEIINTGLDNEDSDINEDVNLQERFQSILSQDNISSSYPPAFITDDPEELSSQSGEEINNDQVIETTDADHGSHLDLSDYWSNPFTTDPIAILDEPIAPDIGEQDEEPGRDEEFSGNQEIIALPTNPGDEKDWDSSAVQEVSTPPGDFPEENENYLEIINEGLAKSTNASEEGHPPNPWEIEPDWSSLANREQSPDLTDTSQGIFDEASQVRPAVSPPEKGLLASIPIFLRILVVALFVIDLVIIGVAGKGFVKALTPLKPTPTAVILPEINYVYPNALKLPGGWIIQLNKGHIVNNKWSPLSAEWLIDTSFRRVIAIPWSKQLEAVTLTLKQGDPIELFMINNDVIAYQVEQVTRVPQNDTSFLERNTPTLILILYRSDSEERWIIICGQQ